MGKNKNISIYACRGESRVAPTYTLINPFTHSPIHPFTIEAI